MLENERHDDLNTFTEENALRDSISPGFYEPACREDGNPLEDEQKLRSFTGQLPGWDGGRRVAVALQSVNTGSGNRQLDINSSPLPRNSLGNEIRTGLPFRELRATTSDLAFRKPKWDKTRKPERLRLNHPLQVQTTADQQSQRAFIGDTIMFYPKSSSSSSATTNSFGAVGDGRFLASASQTPASGGLTIQSARGFGQLHNLRSASWVTAESPSSDSLFVPSLRRELLQKNDFADKTGSFGVSNPFSGINKRLRRRRSFSNSNPSTSEDISSTIARRVSRPVALVNKTSEAHGENKHIQQLVRQRQLSTETETVDPRAPSIWKRDGPTFRSRLSQADQDLFISETRFDPESFALPFGSTIIAMKSDNITDIRTSIKNGIWCSSKHGHEVLEQAWNEHKPEEKIVLIFSVVRSSQYCGIAEMTGPVNVDARPDIFLEKDREGVVPIRWTVVKDVPFVRFKNMLHDGLPVNQLRNAEKVSGGVGRAMLQVYIEAPHSATHILNLGHNASKQKEMAEKARSGGGYLGGSVKPHQNHSHSTSLPPKANKQVPSRFVHPLPPRPPSPRVMPEVLFTFPHSQGGIGTTHPNYGPAFSQETFGFRQPTSSDHIRSTSYGQVASNSWTRNEFIHLSTQSPHTIPKNPTKDVAHERDITCPRRASSGGTYHRNHDIRSFGPHQ